MKPNTHRPSIHAIATIAAVGAAVLLAGFVLTGCGSSKGATPASTTTTTTTTPTTTGTTPSGSASFQAYQSCLQSHGVTLPQGGFRWRNAAEATAWRNAAERTPLLLRCAAESTRRMRQPSPHRGLRRRLRARRRRERQQPRLREVPELLEAARGRSHRLGRPRLLGLPNGAQRLPQPPPEPGCRRRARLRWRHATRRRKRPREQRRVLAVPGLPPQSRREPSRDRRPVASQDTGGAQRVPEAAAGRRRGNLVLFYHHDNDRMTGDRC